MPERTVKTKFFHFCQNNSGGSFDFDEEKGITYHVIVEATSYQDANNRAEEIGLYFHGRASGMDCSCCGDRWSNQWDESNGTETPTIYGCHPSEKVGIKWMDDGKETVVHYMDGTKEWFGVNPSTPR